MDKFSKTWLDFLIQPQLLNEYLNDDTEKIREIFNNIVNAALIFNSINKLEVLYHFENTRLFQEKDKINNLKILALKIASHNYWNLEFLTQDLKPYQIWGLIEFLYQVIEGEFENCKINLSYDKLEENVVIAEYDNLLHPFCLLLKFRYIIHSTICDSFPLKPKKIYTFSIPGQYDQTMIKLLNDGIKNKINIQITIAVNWLEEFLIRINNGALKIYYPKSIYFELNPIQKSLYNEKLQNQQESFKNNIRHLQIIEPNIISCQIYFDLGRYYFMIGDMTRAKDNFSWAWQYFNERILDGTMEKQYNLFFTFNKDMLKSYCLACNLPITEDKIRIIDELNQVNNQEPQIIKKDNVLLNILNKVLYNPANYMQIMPFMICGLTDSIPFEIYTTLYENVLANELWPVEYCKKIAICVAIKSVLMNDGFIFMNSMTLNQNLSGKDDDGLNSAHTFIVNLNKEGQTYFTQMVLEACSATLTTLQTQELKSFVEYLLSQIPTTTKFYEALIKILADHLCSIPITLNQLAKMKVKSIILSKALENIKKEEELIKSIPDSYTLFSNQTFAMAELERKLIISRDPLAIKEILLQLSTNFQRLPPIPSHAHTLLPSYLQTCLINLPPGIRRNFIHLLLSKARQNIKVQEFTNAQVLFQAAENEVILFREQYQGGNENSLGDPLLKSAATLLKYIGWEKLLLEIRRATTSCEDGSTSYTTNKDKGKFHPCHDSKLYPMGSSQQERNSLAMLVKNFLHTLLATEQDLSVLNSEIVCGAVVYLIQQKEYEFLVNFPHSTVFYTNLVSLLTFLKCEFDGFGEEVANVKLVDLSANLKITISKFWDFLNPIFATNANEKSGLYANIPSSHDDAVNDKEIQSLLHLSLQLPPPENGLSSLVKRSKTPPNTTFTPLPPGPSTNARSPIALMGKRFQQPLRMNMFPRPMPPQTPFNHRMTTPTLPPPPPGTMSFGPHHLGLLPQVPPPLNTPMVQPASNFGMSMNQSGHVNHLVQSFLRDFIQQTTDVNYLSILASCLLKIFTLVKDDIFIEFSFDYQQLWPSILLSSQYLVSSMDNLLVIIINRANELKPSVKWLILRADLEYANKNWPRSIEFYVRGLCLKTQYFEPNKCHKLTFPNDIYSRMFKCCLSLRANFEAAMICQLMDPVDYSKAFIALQDVYGVNELDVSNTAFYPESDDCFNLFWDDILLEYLGYLNSNNGPVDKIKRAKIIEVLGNSNLNPNNDDKIITQAKSYKVSKLIQFLTQKYVT